MVKLNLIVAVDARGGIGLNGSIPWNIAEDRHFFCDNTSGGILVMGRLTYESIKRPLPGREIAVVSTQDIPGVVAFPSPEAVVAHYKGGSRPLWFCGGKRIYEYALSLNLDRIYVTRIGADYNCDVHINVPKYLPQVIKTVCVDMVTGEEVSVVFDKYQRAPQRNAESGEGYDMDGPHRESYLQLLKRLYESPVPVVSRNGPVCDSFAEILRFDLSRGFPLLTTKRVFFRGVCEELFFFLRGATDTNELSALGVKIWEPNTSADFLAQAGLPYAPGNMGPMYGHQWRNFGGSLDQLQYCIDLLRTDPHSRRILMTSYNPLEAPMGVLYPCHGICIQFHVGPGNTLNLSMTQRSADVFCGVPFNIASYALLVHLMCAHLGPQWRPGRLCLLFNNAHLYEVHKKQALRQLLRDPRPFPRLEVAPVADLGAVSMNHIKLIDYHPHDSITAVMVA